MYQSKKVITFLVILLISCSTFSQKCKPYKKIKDDFLGKKISYYGGKIGTQRSLFLGVAVSTFILVTKTDEENYNLIYNMQYYQGMANASVNKIKYTSGSTFDLRTADGIKTFTAKEVKNKKMMIYGKTLTASEFIIPITKNDLEYFLNNKLIGYRVSPPEGSTTQGKIKEKAALKLMDQVKCVLAAPAN